VAGLFPGQVTRLCVGLAEKVVLKVQGSGVRLATPPRRGLGAFEGAGRSQVLDKRVTMCYNLRNSEFLNFRVLRSDQSWLKGMKERLLLTA